MPKHFELLDIKIPMFIEDKETLFQKVWETLSITNPSDSLVRVLSTEDVDKFTTSDFKEYLSTKGLSVRHALLFHGNESYTGAPIHLDMHIGGFNPVLNVVVCSGKQVLRIFGCDRPLEEVAKPFKLKNGITMNIFDESDLFVEEQTYDLGPFIMNTSIPHQAKLLSGPSRWCLTLRFSGMPDTWDKFTSLFNDDIIGHRQFIAL